MHFCVSSAIWASVNSLLGMLHWTENWAIHVVIRGKHIHLHSRKSSLRSVNSLLSPLTSCHDSKSTPQFSVYCPCKQENGDSVPPDETLWVTDAPAIVLGNLYAMLSLHLSRCWKLPCHHTVGSNREHVWGVELALLCRKRHIALDCFCTAV